MNAIDYMTEYEYEEHCERMREITQARWREKVKQKLAEAQETTPAPHTINTRTP